MTGSQFEEAYDSAVVYLPDSPPKLDSQDPRRHGLNGAGASGGRAEEPAVIRATPFGWPDPTAIPRRRWLFGHWLLRGEITAIISISSAGQAHETMVATLVGVELGRDPERIAVLRADSLSGMP